MLHSHPCYIFIEQHRPHRCTNWQWHSKMGSEKAVPQVARIRVELIIGATSCCNWRSTADKLDIQWDPTIFVYMGNLQSECLLFQENKATSVIKQYFRFSNLTQITNAMSLWRSSTGISKFKYHRYVYLMFLLLLVLLHISWFLILISVCLLVQLSIIRKLAKTVQFHLYT